MTVDSCDIVDNYVSSPDDCDDSNSDISLQQPKSHMMVSIKIVMVLTYVMLTAMDMMTMEVCVVEMIVSMKTPFDLQMQRNMNGIDDNCDGIVDEMTVVYDDDDSDGFTENTGDCDDTDPQSHPAAQEKYAMVQTTIAMVSPMNKLHVLTTTTTDLQNKINCNDNNATIHPNAEEKYRKWSR